MRRPIATLSRDRARSVEKTESSRGRLGGRTLGEGTTAYLFLLPWFLGLVGLTLGPMIASLYISLTNFSLLSAPRWTGLSNYTQLFADPRYLQSLKVTFIYVFLSVPLKLVLALLVAMILNTKVRGRGFYRAAFYLPSLLAGSVAIAVLWREIFSDNGLLNQVLGLFGLKNLPSWISTPHYALYTLVVLAVWEFGTPMIIFLAGLQQIPRDLYEAAAVDGAGRLHRLRSVTLPLLTPIIFFNLVMQIIGSFKTFTPAYIISGGTGGPNDSTLFYTLYLYVQGFTQFRMGYATAMAWVLMVIIAVFTAINFIGAKYWVYYDDKGS